MPTAKKTGQTSEHHAGYVKFTDSSTTPIAVNLATSLHIPFTEA